MAEERRVFTSMYQSEMKLFDAFKSILSDDLRNAERVIIRMQKIVQETRALR